MNVKTSSVLTNAKRVLIFRALQLGDLLCAVPALRSLRQSMPDAQIALLGLPWAREFVRRYSAYLDEFIEFPGFPGLPERKPEIAAFPGFVAEMQARRFDLTIQMHGSGGIVNSLLELFAAKHNAGYCESAEACPDHERFLPYPNDVHEIRRHLKLAEFLGAPAQDESLEFPLHDRDFEELAQIREATALRGGNYICLHAGARYLTRRWPANRLAAVGDHLAAQGLAVVLTGSTSERELTEAVASQMRSTCLNLAGKTNLGAAGALVAGAQLVITNDTGMSHLAAAVRTPSVVVVLSSDAPRWAPLDADLHPTLRADVPCRPCEHRICPIGFPCAELISSAAVIERAERLLQATKCCAPAFSLPTIEPHRKEALCADSAY